METFLLQYTQWPRGSTVGAPEALYFRAEPRASWLFDPVGSLKAIQASNGEATLDFGSFFSALSLTTWCGAGGLDSIVVSMRFIGSATLKIYEDNGYDSASLLWEQRVRSDGTPFTVSLDGLGSRRGILYPVFSLQRGDQLEFFDLSYRTPTAPKHMPRLAIVMPTFRRELYARRNIDLIRDQVLSREAHRCKLFVIDNGRTLPLDMGPDIQVIGNRNFGGSGGFARGMLELQDHPDAYTHVLFCDDDVLIDPQSIKRVLALLGYVDDDNVISGGMLKMGAKSTLHEKSANVVGLHFSSNKSKADLTDRRVVARYDEGTFATFCGWWFACYPLAAHPERFLPSPFFVGWDDVEMGFRCNRMKLRTLSLLGVAIWHDEFEKKDINWRWYYHTRNGLITSLLYDNSRRALRQTWIEVMTALLTYRYERAEFMLDGLDAVARGSEAISSQPADELHAQLMLRQKNPFVDVSRDVVADRYQLRPKLPPLRKLFASITMNGHMLPQWSFRSAVEPSHSGWIVENIHARSFVRIFRCPKVVYYEPTSGKGMICSIDRARYYRLMGRLMLGSLRMMLSWSRLRAGWRADHPRLISSAFWRDYLGIQQP